MKAKMVTRRFQKRDVRAGAKGENIRMVRRCLLKPTTLLAWRSFNFDVYLAKNQEHYQALLKRLRSAGERTCHHVPEPQKGSL